MFAVVKTGGKQYRVAPGDVIVVEKLLGDAGTKIKLDQVLMIGEDGKSPEVGAPVLDNTAINCEVMAQSRADKIVVFKKKRRKGYKRTRGHRQGQTILRVLDINGKGAVKRTLTKKSTAPDDKETEKVATKTSEAAEAPKQKSAPVKKKASTKKKAASKKKAVTKKKSGSKKKAAAKKSTTKK